MSWVASDACTLPTLEQPLRVAEFDALFASKLRVLERPGPTRLLLGLDPAEDVESLVSDLAERETACCSFFSFSLTRPADGLLRLEIGVPGERKPVLDAVAARAAELAGLPR